MNICDRFVRWGIVVAFTGLLVSSVMNVVTRFVYIGFNTGWTAELARYFSIYVVFLGAGLTTRNKAHASIGIVLSAMGKRAVWSKLASGIKGATVVLEVLVLFVLLIEGVKIAYLVYGQTAPASQIPMTWAYMAIPIGVAMMLIYYKPYLTGGKK